MKSNSSPFSDYRNRWSLGPIIPRSPNEKLDADDIREKLLAKLRTDQAFNREFHRRPREVLSMTVEEALGISAEAFYRQVKRVNLARETRRRLYLKLPSCHFGCQAPTLEAAPPCDSCSVCGRAVACQPVHRAPAKWRTRSERWRVDHELRQKVATRPDFRAALLRSPVATYRQHAADLCAGRTPQYLEGINEVVPLEESSEEIHFVVPIDVPEANAGHHP